MTPAQPRWGVNLPLPARDLAANREVVTGLVDLGYADVWTGEGGGPDAFTPLAAAAAWEPRLRLGAGVVPVFTRGAGVLAQTAATLAELSEAPVMLGVGTSVPAHVTGLNQTPFVRPMARLRDTVRFLKRAVRGDIVSERYETFEVDRFALAAPPVRVPRILVGALRPTSVRLGLTEGDGVITNVLSHRDLTRVLTAAEPVPPGKEVVVKVFVCPTANEDHARRAGRRFLGWITNQAPYRAFHDWLGRAAELERSRSLFDAGQLAAAGAAIPDGVVDELWIHGSPRRCAEQIAAFVQPGVTAVLLYVAPTPELAAQPRVLPDVLAELVGAS